VRKSHTRGWRWIGEWEGNIRKGLIPQKEKERTCSSMRRKEQNLSAPAFIVTEWGGKWCYGSAGKEKMAKKSVNPVDLKQWGEER